MDFDMFGFVSFRYIWESDFRLDDSSWIDSMCRYDMRSLLNYSTPIS